MTGEAKGQTESWVAEKGAKYSYAYDSGKKLMAAFGVTGIPAAFLIDPSGTVVWGGNPGSLTEAEIEKSLAGALTTPMWEWPSAAKSVSKALAKGQLDRALSAAEAFAEKDQEVGPQILGAIRGMVTSVVAKAAAALEEGDFLTAQESIDRVEKAVDGMPESEAKLAEVAQALKANKDAGKVMKGQMAVRKIQGSELRKKRDLEAAISKLDRIAKSLDGTAAAREASTFADELRKRLQDA